MANLKEVHYENTIENGRLRVHKHIIVTCGCCGAEILNEKILVKEHSEEETKNILKKWKTMWEMLGWGV